MQSVIQDLRFGLRSLRRTPGFTLVVVAVMALGIGVNTMVFSMVYGVLWRPLELPGANELVAINTYEVQRGSQDSWDVSPSDMSEIRDRAKSFDHQVAAWWDHQAHVVFDRDVTKFNGATVTANLFDVLKVRPVIGRTFTAEENVEGKNWSTVIISHKIWQEHYGGRADALGKVIRFNGRMRTIVGVAPPKFRWPEIADFWIPMPLNRNEPRTNFQLNVVARLQPGVTVAQANAEVGGIMKQLDTGDPKQKGYSAIVQDYRYRMMQGARPMMMLLMAAVGFVLLIACANVANLLLARGAAREREIAMRRALGASRGRIIRQLLTESALLAVIGGAIGVLLAHWGNRLWISMIPLELPFFMRFDIDATVLAYTAGIAMAAAVAFGLAPALHATDTRLGEALREGSVQTGTSRRGDRMRSTLVVAEVALSLVLLIGAGLMIRSFAHISSLGAALNVERVLTAEILMPIANYPDEPSRRVAMRSLLPQLRTMAGVEKAAGAIQLPLNRGQWTRRIYNPDLPNAEPRNGPLTAYTATTPGFFEAVGVALLRGRDFTDDDDENAPRVAIVNESLARALWPNQDPIGKHIRFQGDPDSLPVATVVGMSRDVPSNVESQEITNAVYVPHMYSGEQVLTLALLTKGDPSSLAAPLRELLRSRFPDIPISEVRTLPEYLKFNRWLQRLFSSLMGTFAVVALIIAAVGLYGVMAYSVAQRTREIGIRMALGAAQNQVLGLVVGRAMRLTFLGLGIGLAAAYGLTRFMAAQLFGVSPTDPPTFAGVAVILALSGIAAAWVPAWRASRVDPMIALRYE